MPTPAFPSGFKPAVQGYSIGAPAGVRMTELAGGMPRIGLAWDRGQQAFEVTMVISQAKFAVWVMFFYHQLRNGSLQFTMPLDSGLGLSDHLCIMVPGSYSAVPVSGSKVWSVRFTILAESQVYTTTPEDADELLALWEVYGEGLEPLLARLAQFATVDTLVLMP